MATKKDSLRIYNFSDAFLKQLADQLLANIERDVREFEERGFNEAKRRHIQALTKEFDSLPTDEYLEGIKITTTEERDKSREMVERQVRTIFVMAENLFGVNSGKYRTFGDAGLTRLSDDQMVRNAKGVVRAANLYFQDLEKEGLTKDFLITLEKYILTFDEAIDAQIVAIRNRDIAAEERIDQGNALYTELVKLCNTGKDIFYSTNEAKYNDYVIYNTSTGKATDAPPAA